MRLWAARQGGRLPSRCPGHDGENPDALHVTLKLGVILLHCFAHDCAAEEIVERIGLRMVDLFPADQHYAGRLRPARREDFTGNAREPVNVLAALERLGLRWRDSIEIDECPNCESPHPQLVFDSTGEPFLHCARGCSVEAFAAGLAERLRTA